MFRAAATAEFELEIPTQNIHHHVSVINSARNNKLKMTIYHV
jgi:hypothetical protein